MKTIVKYLACLAVAGIMTIDTQAQGWGRHGGYGGGFHGRVSAGACFGGGFRGGFGGGYRGGFGVGFHNRGYYYGGYRNPVFRGGYGGWRTGYYRPYYYPRVGVWLGTLPMGYYSFMWGANQYYYANGAFYQPYNNGYQAVDPPLGASLPVLPRGSRAIMIDGVQYYEYNGVYYYPYTNNNGSTAYEVAGRDGVLNTQGTDNNSAYPQNDQQWSSGNSNDYGN